jgi:hypothetical protein
VSGLPELEQGELVVAGRCDHGCQLARRRLV